MSGLTRGLAWASALVVAIVIVIGIFKPGLFAGIFSSMAVPFWRTQAAIELGSVKSNDSLLKENAYLQQQLDAATIRLQSIQALENENTELKSLLGRASTSPYILAAVLRRPPLAAYDELIIDLGSNDGVQVGNRVYASGNVLIGHVSQVSETSSKVSLFSSPEQSYPVLIGPTHAPATAIGRGGGQYEAQIPRDIQVHEGDAVIVPSLEVSPFGIVSSVVMDPTQPFEKILFAPPVNIYQLRWVLVDTKRQI